MISLTWVFWNNRKNGLEHLFNVANMANLFAKIENLDQELAPIIGILHDLATYKYHKLVLIMLIVVVF